MKQNPGLLILGGSGFVSGTLARTAVAQGWKVWVVTRGERALPPGVTGLVADRHDDAGLEKTIAGSAMRWDLVVDCIAYKPADAQQDVRLFRDRADHLVLISTDFVMDPAHRKFPQPEEGVFMTGESYGAAKRLCELELLEGDTGAMGWTILRPNHIYGPGSELGCLPCHGRDPKLIENLRKDMPLKLVGGGHFLQQPIFAEDLADLILSVKDRPQANRQIFFAAGPEIIESREYYQIIARTLRVDLRIEEVSVTSHLEAHPEAAPFLCHRVYDLARLRSTGMSMPQTPMERGLRTHVESLLARR